MLGAMIGVGRPYRSSSTALLRRGARRTTAAAGRAHPANSNASLTVEGRGSGPDSRRPSRYARDSAA
jgi:hypothetical protein